MKKFEEAELEVITFEEDVVVASSCPEKCWVVGCPANSCQCNKHMVCEGQNNE